MYTLQRWLAMFLYLTFAGYAILALRLFVAAFLEARKPKVNKGSFDIHHESETDLVNAAVAFRQRGWANTWLPKSPYSDLPTA